MFMSIRALFPCSVSMRDGVYCGPHEDVKGNPYYTCSIYIYAHIIFTRISVVIPMYSIALDWYEQFELEHAKGQRLPAFLEPVD